MTVETYASLREAEAAMGPDARFLAGGTLLMRNVNHAEGGFARILRAEDPDLSAIRVEGDRISIGAGATLAEIAAHGELGFLAPVARSIGGPAVRNMGTLGGNLFAPHPFGDLAAALLALDGEARMADGSSMPLAELLARRNSAPGLVAAVSATRPARDDFRFRKVGRSKPKGASVLSISAWLPRSGGRVGGARIVYGAMGSAPTRAEAAERELEGATLDPQGVAPAVAAAAEGLNPPDDALASGWYRTQVAGIHLQRLLLDVEDR